MTPGLRERKKAATRLALHEAALRLTAERGLDAVTVDDIAERADVSPRTFFNYFASKDDAVTGLDPATAQDLATAFRARPADEPPLTSLRTIHRELAGAMAEEAELWTLRMSVIAVNPTLIGRLAAAFGESEEWLAVAIAERTGTQVGVDAYAALLAATQAGVVRTALLRWLAIGPTASLPDLVDEAWDLIAGGLPDPRA